MTISRPIRFIPEDTIGTAALNLQHVSLAVRLLPPLPYPRSAHGKVDILNTSNSALVFVVKKEHEW